MEYRIVPFHPTVTDKSAADQTAVELQNLINNELKNGWKFKSVQSITTMMKPTGCVGFLGGKAEAVPIQLVILEK